MESCSRAAALQLTLQQREREEPPLDALEDGEEEHGRGRVLQQAGRVGPGAGFDPPRGVTTPALPPGWPTPAKACFGWQL